MNSITINNETFSPSDIVYNTDGDELICKMQIEEITETKVKLSILHGHIKTPTSMTRKVFERSVKHKIITKKLL